MYARISVYEVDSDRRAEATATFRKAFARLREVEGIEGAYFMLGCEGRRAVSITLWESQSAMAASRVVASRLRSDAAGAVEGEIVSVDEYEVALVEGKPSASGSPATPSAA